MIRLWKNFRVNLMYWRFRHITRNRLRLQSWYRRRQPVQGFRPRGGAAYVHRRSGRRSWIALFLMVVALTAVRVWGNHSSVSNTLVWILIVAVIAGTLYWAIRGI